MKTSISRLPLTCMTLAVLTTNVLFASDIDFAHGTWVHPNGPSTNGWNSAQLTGTTTLADGVAATATVSFAGTAQPTLDNLKYTNESYFIGFAFQQLAPNAVNSGTLKNYMRIDIQFSQEVNLNNFVINDVDVEEVVQAEGWTSAPASPGSGIPASFSKGSEVVSYALGGVNGVTSKTSANTTLDTKSDVGISFNSSIKALSVYYSKRPGSAAPWITIGIKGNIQISPAKPRLYFTYNMTNNEAYEKPVDFSNTLPEGLVFDTEYMELSGTLTGSPIVFSNGNRTASANNIVMHPGANSLKLRTLETSKKGLITNVATMNPKHPQLPPLVQTTTITLP